MSPHDPRGRESAAPAIAAVNAAAEEYVHLLMSELLPPHNDREHRDKDIMERMTASIESHGFLKPSRVTREGDKYRVRTGWTRVLCGRRAGKTHAPALVVSGAYDEAEDLIEKFIENECAGETNPLDRAAWALKLMKLKGWSRAELARRAHLSRGQVTKDLSMFERLIDELKAKVYDGTLCPRGGYHLSRLTPEQQKEEWPKVAHMCAQGIEDHVNGVLGRRRRRERPTKARTARGLQLLFPAGMDHDGALAELAAAGEAVRKSQRLNTPFSTVPHLLKA